MELMSIIIFRVSFFFHYVPLRQLFVDFFDGQLSVKVDFPDFYYGLFINDVQSDVRVPVAMQGVIKISFLA